RAIAPVGRRGDLLSQLGLANVHPALPAGEHGIDAVFAEQLREFAQAIGVGVDLRLDVAPGDLRRAGIGADERLHVAIEFAAAPARLPQTDRWRRCCWCRGPCRRGPACGRYYR